MPLGQATCDVTYFHLVTVDDMVSAWKQLPSVQYHGTLDDWTNPDTHQVEYALMANGDIDQQKNIRAILGEVLIWDGSVLSVISYEEFTGGRYDIISQTLAERI